MYKLTILNLETGEKIEMLDTEKCIAFATIEALEALESLTCAKHRCFLKYIGNKEVK